MQTRNNKAKLLIYSVKPTIFASIMVILPLLSVCQQHYSIDQERTKKGARMTIRQYIQYRKALRIEKKQRSRMAIMDSKTNELAKQHAKKQTKKVQKRMKQTREKADKFNKGKPQVSCFTSIKFKLKKIYGRLF